jgi:hypothetical protein
MTLAWLTPIVVATAAATVLAWRRIGDHAETLRRRRVVRRWMLARREEPNHVDLNARRRAATQKRIGGGAA